MAVDKAKFEEYLTRQGQWQGGRCKDARNSDDGDIIAAALAMSCMANLQHAAASKVLTATDIDAFMNAFLEASNMEEQFQPMGGSVFVRKPS